MNIFCIYDDPAKSAQQLCDQHVNKMVLESAQMIANCFSLDTLESAPKTAKGTARKHSYYNHPCSIWVRETKANFKWLLDHALAMEQERLARGYNPHFSTPFIQWALDNINKSLVPNGERSEFAVAIAEDMSCRNIDGFDTLSSVEKYKLYYKYDKSFATWKQNKPSWI